MAALVVLYNPPEDPAAFDEAYFARHVPLANALPKITSNVVSRGPVMTPQGPSPYHRVVTLTFASMADLQAAMASPEGQAAAADAAQIATAGMQFLIFEDEQMLSPG